MAAFGEKAIQRQKGLGRDSMIPPSKATRSDPRTGDTSATPTARKNCITTQSIFTNGQTLPTMRNTRPSWSHFGSACRQDFQSPGLRLDNPPRTQQRKPARKVMPRRGKLSYFAKHPDADANKDGELTWVELKAYRERIGDKK